MVVSSEIWDATRTGNIRLIERFIDQGGDINEKANTGRTLLHEAVIHGQSELVYFLISHGANPNAQDAHLKTPLILAAEYTQVEILNNSMIGIFPMDINIQDSFGRTVLHWACGKGLIEVCTKLIQLGAIVNQKTTSGDTPLHWVVMSPDLPEIMQQQLVTILLTNGADPTIQNSLGESPVNSAVFNSIQAELSTFIQEQNDQKDQERAKFNEEKKKK